MRGFRYVAIGVAAALAGMIEISAYPLPYPYFYVNPLRTAEKLLPNAISIRLAWKRYENTGLLYPQVRKLDVGCSIQKQSTNETIKNWLLDHCTSEIRPLYVKAIPADFQRKVSEDLPPRSFRRVPEIERNLNDLISHDEKTNLTSINQYMNSIGFAYLRKHVIKGEDVELQEYFGLKNESSRTRLIYTDVTKLPLSSDQALDVSVTLITNGPRLLPKTMVAHSRPYRFAVNPKMERLNPKDLNLLPTEENNDFPMYLYRE